MLLPEYDEVKERKRIVKELLMFCKQDLHMKCSCPPLKHAAPFATKGEVHNHGVRDFTHQAISGPFCLSLPL
jgi:hypothetical protein